MPSRSSHPVVPCSAAAPLRPAAVDQARTDATPFPFTHVWSKLRDCPLPGDLETLVPTYQHPPLDSILRPAATTAGVPWITARFKRLTEERKPENLFIAPHRHTEYEAIFLKTGAYACAVNEVWMDFSPGDGLIVQSGDWHHDRCCAGGHYYALMFGLETGDGRPAPSLFLPNVSPEGRRFSLGKQRGLVWSLLDCIQHEGKRPDPFSGPAEDALALAVFWNLVRTFPRTAIHPLFLEAVSDGSFAAQLMRVFQRNLDRNLSVEEMAARLNMSESSLAHKCKVMLGDSPYKVFLKCRMERACHLLSDTSLLIKEIAGTMGYPNEYVFSRTFKTVIGMPPQAWRQNNYLMNS